MHTPEGSKHKPEESFLIEIYEAVQKPSEVCQRICNHIWRRRATQAWHLDVETTVASTMFMDCAAAALRSTWSIKHWGEEQHKHLDTLKTISHAASCVCLPWKMVLWAAGGWSQALRLGEKRWPSWVSRVWRGATTESKPLLSCLSCRKTLPLLRAWALAYKKKFFPCPPAAPAEESLWWTAVTRCPRRRPNMSSFRQRYQGMVSSFWCLSARLLLLSRFWPIVKRCSLDLNQGRKLHCLVWIFERRRSSGSASGVAAVACLVPEDRDVLPTSAFSCTPPDA